MHRIHHGWYNNHETPELWRGGRYGRGSGGLEGGGVTIGWVFKVGVNSGKFSR